MTVETVTLLESGIARGKGLKRRAKIVAADTWGSTAYYPADVIERDGPRVYVAGVQMFENHQTEDEQWQRPEGSVANLVGKLTSDSIYEADNPEGPGLYADVEFYESYGDRINEIGDDVGLSMNAKGLTEWGVIGEREGPVLLAMTLANSLDVVTKAGAGGKLVSILESERGTAGRPINEKGNQSVTDVTKEDFESFAKDIKESLATLVGDLKEALKPEPVEAVVVEEEPKAAVEEEKEIDIVAIAEALRTENLPAEAASAVVRDVREGATLEDALKKQTDLREAFTANNESGTVVIKEAKTTSALEAAVALLG